MNVLQKPQAVTALTSLGVDVEAALDYGHSEAIGHLGPPARCPFTVSFLEKNCFPYSTLSTGGPSHTKLA